MNRGQSDQETGPVLHAADWLDEHACYRRSIGLTELRKALGRTKGHCTWCGGAIDGNATRWCSRECREAAYLRCDLNTIRRYIRKRDGGLCAACGADCRSRQPWEADHIVPVVEGGGCKGPENYRTLCVPCHKAETKKLAARRSAQRRDAARNPPTDQEPGVTTAATPEPSNAEQLEVHVRWKIRRDMERVLEIEQSAFEFPWSEGDFVRCLRRRDCIGMVAERDERVLGFMVYELRKKLLHLLNFAVDSDARRHGVGSQMVEKLIGKLSHQRRTRVTLEVRETNQAALLFFKHAGFRATGVLRGFYDDSPEDAIAMQYTIGGEG